MLQGRPRTSSSNHNFFGVRFGVSEIALSAYPRLDIRCKFRCLRDGCVAHCACYSNPGLGFELDAQGSARGRSAQIELSYLLGALLPTIEKEPHVAQTEDSRQKCVSADAVRIRLRDSKRMGLWCRWSNEHQLLLPPQRID